eukprot:1158650-Pleurochrysis_carterae.AAC.1
MRVSVGRRLQGKKLHLGRIKRQFPRCGLKSRQTVCERSAPSSIRRRSRAPSAPFASSSHARSTLSSCACVTSALVYSECVCLPPGFPGRFTPFFPASHLFLLLYIECVFRSCGLLLRPRRLCPPSGLCHQFDRALALLCAVCLKSFTLFAMCPGTQLTPFCLLVEYKRTPDSVIRAWCVWFDLEGAFVIF